MEAERPGPGKDDTREEDRGSPGRHGGDRPAGSLLGPPCGDTGPENCVRHPGWGTSVPCNRPPGPGRLSGGREGTSPGVCRAHALPLYPVGSGPPHPKTPQGPAQLRGIQILSGDHGPGELRGAGIPPGQGSLRGPCLQAVTRLPAVLDPAGTASQRGSASGLWAHHTRLRVLWTHIHANP